MANSVSGGFVRQFPPLPVTPAVRPPFAHEQDEIVIEVRGSIEPLMVYIPAGSFLMGTSDQQVEWLARHDDLAEKWRGKGYFGREQPQHLVPLEGYFIGRFPVMVGEFGVFVEANGYLNRRWWTDAGWEWREAAEREAGVLGR